MKKKILTVIYFSRLILTGICLIVFVLFTLMAVYGTFIDHNHVAVFDCNTKEDLIFMLLSVAYGSLFVGYIVSFK